MASIVSRKAAPELIQRKSSASSGAANATPAAALSSGLAAMTTTRSSAVAQIHRSLKAWRAEEKAPETAAPAAPAAEEKLDDGGKDEGAKAKGGGAAEQSTANKDLAQADGKGAEGGGDAAATAGAEGKTEAPAEGGAEAAEVTEEAPEAGTKLKRKVHLDAKGDKAAKKAQKQEEIAKKKEILKAKVELAAAQAEQFQKITDLIAGFGLDALMTAAGVLAGPAGAAVVAAIKTAAGVAQDGVNIAMDAQREVQTSVLTKAIEQMGASKIKTLYNSWTSKEPKLKEMEAQVQFHAGLIRDAGIAGGPKDLAAKATKGVAEEGAKKGATFFAEKLIPFFGTALKIGEVIKAVKDVGDAKEALEKLETELTELA